MRSPDQVAAMQCPVCRVPLAMSDRQGIEIDYCPQCRGVWLDRGELDKIVERSAAQAAPAPAPAPAPPPPQAQVDATSAAWALACHLIDDLEPTWRSSFPSTH